MLASRHWVVQALTHLAPTISSPTQKMTAITALPNEILFIIFRMATSDPSSLKARFDHPLELATYRAGEDERQHDNLQVKMAISLVCKRWSAISVPLLSEHIPYVEVPYLCAFVDVTRRHSLLAYLAKEDEEGRGKRGRWTRRLDLYFCAFERNRYELQQTNEACPNVLDSWEDIISPDLIPNLTVLDISSKYCAPLRGQKIHFFQAIGKLENLRRVEWSLLGADLYDLRELSIYCPRLNHIAFQLIDIRVLGDFIISLPHVGSIVLRLTGPQSRIPSVYQPWDLPKLHHFGFCTKYSGECNGFIQKILHSAKGHITSLDLMDYGRETFPRPSMDLVCSFPKLETLYLDPSRFWHLVEDPRTLSSYSFPLLHTLGWRIDGEGEGKWKWIEKLVSNQFDRRRFPNLSTLLSLENLESRVRSVTIDIKE
jgi:hypothetical protein